MIPLAVAVVYCLFYWFPVSETVGVWLSILSHLFALPIVVSGFSNFLSLTTAVTVVASTLFHTINDLADADTEKHFRRFDHAWSVFIIYAVLFKVYYTKIPQWGTIVLTLVATIPAAFLTNPRTYLPLAVIALLLMLWLLVKKFNRSLLLAFILFVSAIISRYLPIADNKYHRHSVWHALVFTSIYYAHLGIVANENEKKLPYYRVNP